MDDVESEVNSMKLSLVVLAAGKQQGKVLEIKLSQFVVGRDPQCHLRPASALISKRHCAVLQRDGKAFVRDFDSTNGTFVNNQPVKGEVELHNGDQLKIGPLHFEVRLEVTPPVNRPTPAPPTRAAKAPAKQPAATPVGAPPAPAAEAPAPESDAEIPAPTDETPAAPAAAAAGGSSTEDDDIAAMLLSLHDDGSPASPPRPDEVPEGSTVMDLVVPPPGSDPKAQALGKEKEKPKAPPGNTASAAKSILEKYMRRPRPTA